MNPALIGALNPALNRAVTAPLARDRSLYR
jgi:hypothetical protein